MEKNGKSLDYDNETRSFINITAMMKEQTFDNRNNKFNNYTNLKQVRLCTQNDFIEVGKQSLFDSFTVNRNSLICIDNYVDLFLTSTLS